MYTPPKLTNSLRASLIRTREWLFLVENRMLIAVGFLAVIFLILLAIELLTSFDKETLQPLFYIFGALIGGDFTLITIVISINLLVISQQLGAPGDLRRQIEETNKYREAVEEEVDRDVAPLTPTDFLQLLFDQTKAQLDTVSDELEGVSDTEARDDLEQLASRLRTQIEHVETLLSRAEVGLFEALSVTLQTNYSQEIFEIRTLTDDHSDQYSDRVADALNDLVVRLEQIDVARQYLKTLYIQDELAKISRVLLYTVIPAVVVAIIMMHQFAASNQVVLTPTVLSALVPVALTIGIAPLSVLFTFVLRVSMVSQRTVAITPFTTPSQEESISPDSLVGDTSDSDPSSDGQ